MKYLIHTCNKRLWYVKKYLIPSMIKQGIENSDIIIYLDKYNKGNLTSYLNSCKYIRDHIEDDLIWHLQDDVLICKDFKIKTETLSSKADIVCGFCCFYFDESKYYFTGLHRVNYMWLSFPCIMIHKKLTTGFIDWFELNVVSGKIYQDKYKTNRMDDFFFITYIRTRHARTDCYNVLPNLVEHIDYLIGNSTLHPGKICKSIWFEDKYLVDNLKIKLKKEEEKNVKIDT